jgi:hypothetical protein
MVHTMKIEIVQIDNISAFVGVRVNADMSNLGDGIGIAFDELISRRDRPAGR